MALCKVTILVKDKVATVQSSRIFQTSFMLSFNISVAIIVALQTSLNYVRVFLCNVGVLGLLI